MAAKQNLWQRKELLAAFALYCQMPFGKMHRSNPDVIRLANLIGRTPSSVAMKLVNFASLDPAITSTGRHGLGNASSADKKIWDEFHKDWEQLALESANVIKPLSKNQDVVDQEAENMGFLEHVNYEGATKAVLTTVRIKQSFFRRAVLSSYQNRCCISSLKEPKLLIASHIVPWSIDKANRLNPRNGLCLSALHDRAFDLGLITITPKYLIKVSKQMKTHAGIAMIKTAIMEFDGTRIQLPEKFWPSQEFLEWHNKNIFDERNRE